ncbi:MAG: hypothetical protein JSS60_09715 [Verrucomicrobia bacterium]|nr:hypothetical protein [Verrucomicrobiota bacterium]
MNMQKYPLIEFSSSFFEDNQLENYYIIGVQHILGTTHEMFKALFKKGLKPENVSLIGKCYSTVPEVFNAMREEGMDVCDSSHQFDSHVPFDEMFQANIRRFLAQRQDRMNSAGFAKIIILDDGGELLELIDDFLTRSDNVIGIEQTSSGYNKLVGKQHSLPIINLARAEIKKTMECPIIIDAAMNMLNSKLAAFTKKPEKILIMGKGVLGAKIKEILEKSYEVKCYDVNPEVSDIAPHQLQQELKEFDLIIGCTGRTSLTEADHKHLKKGCTLMSISSSDREFDAISLRKKTAKTVSCFEDVVVDGIKLLNCGFPINFTGQGEKEDLNLIQLTRALIISSIQQASVCQSKPGFVDMEMDIQQMIAKEFKKYI